MDFYCLKSSETSSLITIQPKQPKPYNTLFMKRNFTQFACLFWVMLLVAVFTSGSAVAQQVTGFTLDKSCIQTGDAVTITINGSGFVDGPGNNAAKVEVNNVGIDVVSVTTDRVIATTTTAVMNTAGQKTIRLWQKQGGDKGYYNVGTFTVYSPTPAPSAINDERCGTGSVTLGASGAPTGGSYRWYTVQTGGTAINEATGASYTTPSLSVGTTTYYVSSVSSQGCESTRTAVTAIVKPSPAFVVTNPSPVCSPATVDLTNPALKSVNGGITYTYWTNSDATLALADPAKVATSGTYYIKGTNTSGCFEIKPVTVTVNPQSIVTGGISSTTDEPKIGEEVTYTLKSNLIDNTDLETIEWFMVKQDSRTSIDRSGATSIKITPSSNEPFEIECVVQAKSGTCYEEPNKTFTTQKITPLPVEIIYFNAAKQGNNVLLEWATASEERNTGFEVQVSQDGFNFRKLDFVATKNGNTSQKQVYQYTDKENGKRGTRYYRLKQVDTDGTFEYFTTKAVTFTEVASKVKAFPNPFSNKLTLDIAAESSGEVQVNMSNAIGKQLMERTIKVEEGFNTINLEVSTELPHGVYFLRVYLDGKVHQLKLLKE